MFLSNFDKLYTLQRSLAQVIDIINPQPRKATRDLIDFVDNFESSLVYYCFWLFFFVKKKHQNKAKSRELLKDMLSIIGDILTSKKKQLNIFL